LGRARDSLKSAWRRRWAQNPHAIAAERVEGDAAERWAPPSEARIRGSCPVSGRSSSSIVGSRDVPSHIATCGVVSARARATQCACRTMMPTIIQSWVPRELGPSLGPARDPARCCLCLGAETSLGLIAHVCEALRRALFNRSAARRTFPRRHRAAQRSGHSRAGIPAASLDPSVGPGRLARVDPGNGSCRMPVVSLDPTLGACLRVPSVVPSGTRVGIAATVLLDPLVRAT
jgi:hypothetical protein